MSLAGGGTEPTASPLPVRGRGLTGAGRIQTVVAPVVIALIAAVAGYWPALDSPFFGDDYILAVASRDMPLNDFLRAAFDPHADPGQLQLSEAYWRPLSFLSFRVIYAAAGDATLPYHLFNLGAHLAAVLFVYMLGLRLTRSRLGAATAAFIMALHPAGFESVAWIASNNSASLPLALAAWLAFTRAVDTDSVRSRWVWLGISLLLVLLALMYRETVLVITMAMLAWFVLIERGRSMVRSDWLTVIPFVALLAAYVLLTAVTDSDSSSTLIELTLESLRTWWYYLRQAVLPVKTEGLPMLFWVQSLLAVGLLSLPLLAAARKQWLPAFLGASFLAALVPYAVFSLGHGARYFYIPGALFALFIGSMVVWVAELSEWSFRGWRVSHRVCTAGMFILVLVTSGLLNGRVSEWVRLNPDVHEAWASQLQAAHPTLPRGGGLFAVNTPLILNYFDAAILQPTVDYHYEGGGHRVRAVEEEDVEETQSLMTPDDRMFFYQE